MVDFGARVYDSGTIRFFSIDPMAYLCPNISLYSFAGNNPIKYIDAMGKFRIDAQFAKMYPNFAKVVEYVIPYLKDNYDFREKFQKLADLDNKAIDEIFTFGTGPWLSPTQEWTQMSDPSFPFMSTCGLQFDCLGEGIFDRQCFPENIFICKDIIESFEKEFNAMLDNGSSDELQFILFKIMIFTIHESRHYGVFRGLGAADAIQREGRYDQGSRLEDIFFGASAKGDGLSTAESREYFNNELKKLSGGATFLKFDIGSLECKPQTKGEIGDPSTLIRKTEEPIRPRERK